MSDRPPSPASFGRVEGDGDPRTAIGIKGDGLTIVIDAYDEGDTVVLVEQGGFTWIYQLPPPRRRPWWKRWFGRA